MNIALIGYGKMGHAVEQVALSRGHQIVAKFDGEWDSLPEGTDLAIEFSQPDVAADNIIRAVRAGIPVVSGTTGWLDRWDEVVAVVKKEQGSFFYATNYSIGVYLFRKINKRLAKLMSSYPSYLPSMEETHHIHKLDYPSGTAITLGEEIQERLPHLAKIRPYLEGEEPEEVFPNELPIKCIREGEVPGTHVVTYDSPVDTIRIEHKAKGRDGFALGAVLAAEFVADKQGIFNMKDLVG